MHDAIARRRAHDRGRAAESHVADALVRVGAEVLARNWSGGGGELDLVVRRDGRIRFVEVKARADDGVDPLESIGPRKRARLVRAAEAWMVAHPHHAAEAVELAFLVAVVDLAVEPWSVAWIDAAFDGG